MGVDTGVRQGRRDPDGPYFRIDGSVPYNGRLGARSEMLRFGFTTKGKPVL